MYSFILESNGYSVTGEIPYCDLPDLKYEFESGAQRHGATTTQTTNTLEATKGDNFLRLRIVPKQGKVQGGRVYEQLNAAMDRIF